MSEARQVLIGSPSPLGAHWDGSGVNFAVYSEGAERVELCFFDPTGAIETERITLPEKTVHVWHAYIPGVAPGQLYGYRVYGPHQPEAGLRFNPNKLLIDPYARALKGDVDWSAPVFGYQLGDEAQDLSFDDTDDAAGVPKCVIVDPAFDWGDDAPPRVPWSQTVIYEVHVKGFTQQHPGVPEECRGAYAGLASEAAIAHLRELGVTAVELLPVHAHVDSDRLISTGLSNYWGYDSIGFFAPDARYSSRGATGGQVVEFKEMVRALHRQGIEVILDVVYNHTPEGNELGPTLSFRGLDNPSYYRLVPDQERYYMDYTGTGNTLNVRHPEVLRLIMDSLRYWVQEMHVDGFRFDLASALARALHDVDMLSTFFDAIHQDPVISQVKLIAEPWDVGEGGYQVGNFPALWTEWNGRYRDSVRRFWRGDENNTAELAYRITGSSDLYAADGRRPYASINFVTAHDGFTLNDLVSYDGKHNEANGEDNRDGTNDNVSWNHGAEGPTEDEAIIELRERQKRNFLATLLFSQGVPMICGGDEMGRTQQGNNNAYCQDNQLSWSDWQLDERQNSLLDFTRRLIEQRRLHPVLRRRHFFSGGPIHGSDIKDITWLRTDGHEMADEEWDAPWLRCFGVRLDGHLDEVDERGQPVEDDVHLLIFNADSEPQDFMLGAWKTGVRWLTVIDTARPDLHPDNEGHKAGEAYRVEGRSLVLLRLPNET